ncbi:MAG: dihydroorotate dehydrogenase [bacterium]|nr:dihydroorotate dehydrogenase [bacterium]
MKEVKENPLKVTFAGIDFESPFLPASGTFGYGAEPGSFKAIHCFGGLITKGLSFKKREGNPPPRIKETPCGLVNSIGLENPGVEEFISSILPEMLSFRKPIIVNLAGHDEEDFLLMIEKLNPFKEIVAYEINISCPNVSKGGLEFFRDKKALKTLLREIAGSSNKVNIVKIPPDIFHFDEIIDLLLSEGFVNVTVSNTYPAMVIDIEKMDFYFERKSGGLSGPAIFPLTLRLVYEIASKYPELNIIASGGVVSYVEAVQYFLVGAKLVQIGSGNFIDPNIVCKVKLDLENFLVSKGLYSLNKIVGKLLQTR